VDRSRGVDILFVDVLFKIIKGRGGGIREQTNTENMFANRIGVMKKLVPPQVISGLKRT
jgi:hypothetical protein